MGNWQKLSSQNIYKNKWMSVTEDQVINPAGQETVYGYYDLATNFLYVVPVDKDGDTYIVKQYRYPLSEDTWEFTAGQDEGEQVDKAARRELLEETGLEVDKIKELGTIYADSGISSARGKILIATDARKVTDELDKIDGIIEVKKVSFSEVRDMILKGEIKCPHTISAYFMATEYLKEKE